MIEQRASLGCPAAACEREQERFFREAASVIKTTPIEDDYQIFYGRKLGAGKFANVFKCTDKRTGESYAVKIVNKHTVPAALDVLDEIEVHLLCSKHPNVVGLRDAYINDPRVCLVMELMEGGELFESVARNIYLSEDETRGVMRTLLSVVHFLHSNNIVHRDLKLENLLFTDSSANARLKVGDFGFSKIIKPTASLTAKCYTPIYAAPEILQGKPYDHSVDCWQLGVIAYVLLCGYPPFDESDGPGLYSKILEGSYTFHAEFWDHVSRGAKDFVSRLLLLDPAERMTVDEAICHPWITKGYESSDTCDGLSPPQANVLATSPDLRLDVQAYRRMFRKALEDKQTNRKPGTGGAGNIPHARSTVCDNSK